ncbi:hypothetical protein P692DRAFT_20877725 [Suillus brevipes Sb2]|nr:hypothetical protein P692DRAFT_20877725 [Suillus brevipes Sb2]
MLFLVIGQRNSGRAHHNLPFSPTLFRDRSSPQTTDSGAIDMDIVPDDRFRVMMRLPVIESYRQIHGLCYVDAWFGFANSSAPHLAIAKCWTRELFKSNGTRARHTPKLL